MMGIFKILTVSALLFVWFTATYSLDMEGSIENSCFKVEPVKLDLDWGFKQFFYMPMVSRAKLYHLVAQMLKPVKASEIIEGSVYYDSCIRWQFFKNSSVIVSGYGGTKETNYLTGPKDNGGFFRPVEGKGHSGTFWVTKTDNKSYIVEVACSENEMSWAVLSRMPKLASSTVKDIKKHLIKIGFKKAYFTELRYDKCPNQ